MCGSPLTPLTHTAHGSTSGRISPLQTEVPATFSCGLQDVGRSVEHGVLLFRAKGEGGVGGVGLLEDCMVFGTSGRRAAVKVGVLLSAGEWGGERGGGASLAGHGSFSGVGSRGICAVTCTSIVGSYEPESWCCAVSCPA